MDRKSNFLDDRRVIVILFFTCLLLCVDVFFGGFPFPGSDIPDCGSLVFENNILFYKTGLYPPSAKEIPVDLAPLFFQPVNINNAAFENLILIKGIGPKLAATILEYRRLHGPFVTVDDLLSVKGIGRKRARYFSTVLQFSKQSEKKY